MSVLDQSVKCFKYFEEISKIPHGSYNEKGICDYVENFAKERNLAYYRDAMHNIVVYKDATPDYENHAPVMLQGHLDMVNEKNKDSNHDFDKDPLDLYIDEDNWLHARGTTLGADDGTAVSYMLSLLDSDDIKHPALDCVFTVQEEVGLIGAMNFDCSKIRAHRLINMDSGGETTTSVSSSGGRRAIVEKEVTYEENTLPVYELFITGLLGGHSGGLIHKERGNSNKLALRIMHDLLKQGVDIRLVHLEGGLKENAIPREATIKFASSTKKETIEKLVKESAEKILVELEFSDPGFKAILSESESKQAMSQKLSSDIIRMIFLLPNGFKARSMKIEGLTTVSLNLGVLRTENNKVTCYFSIRSPMAGAIEQLSYEMEEIADIFGANAIRGAEYPGWSYEAVSPMRELMKVIVKEHFNKELTEHAGHGGLETGVFKGGIPDLDIVTFGPIASGGHTPDEKLNLDSFKHCYEVLLDILSRL